MYFKRNLRRMISTGLFFSFVLLGGCGNDTHQVQNDVKVITDLTGSQVSIKDKVERIAIVPIPWTSIVYSVDKKGDKIVGMHPSSKKAYEISMLKQLAPNLETVNSTFVDNNFNINLEEVAKLKPDVVVIWDYQEDVGKKLKEIGVPSVSIKYGTLKNIQDGIQMVGDMLNKQEDASQLIQYHKDSEEYFKNKTNQVKESEKKKVLYLQNKNLSVAGNKSVNQIMIEQVGGENVAKDVDGQWVKVSMEEIMKWDPDIIILSNFDSFTPDDLYKDSFDGQNWSNIRAVREKHVYKSPLGIYRWDAPSVETPLMMKWLGKVIHPEIFNDYTIKEELSNFYTKFYEYNLSNTDLDRILNTAINRDLTL